jgi:hypothetical protein
MKAALNDLNSVVLRAINGMEAGDTKQEAVQSITSFVKMNYIRKATLGDLDNLPAEDAMMLHERHGIEFKVNDGKVSGVRFGGVNHHTDNALVG